MKDRILEALARFAIRHERALTIAGAIWFAISCASQARFVELPRIPFLTDRYAFWLAGGWNAIWWGFLHPQIEQRKASLVGKDKEPAG